VWTNPHAQHTDRNAQYATSYTILLKCAKTRHPFRDTNTVASLRETHLKVIVIQDLAPNPVDESSMKYKRLAMMHKATKTMKVTCTNYQMIFI